MALFQSFMPEGVNQKSQAFVLLIGKGSFLKMSTLMPMYARFTRSGFGGTNTHLKLQCSASTVASKLFCPCSSSESALSLLLSFVSFGSHVLKRLAAPACVLRPHGLTLLKTQALPRRGAAHSLLGKKLVERKAVHCAVPIEGDQFMAVCEHDVFADVSPAVVFNVAIAMQAARQFPLAPKQTKPPPSATPQSNGRIPMFQAEITARALKTPEPGAFPSVQVSHGCEDLQSLRESLIAGPPEDAKRTSKG